MRQFAELITLSPEEVKNKLVDKENDIILKETKPPGKKQGQGKKRVINLKQADKTTTIFWCYEDYI